MASILLHGDGSRVAGAVMEGSGAILGVENLKKLYRSSEGLWGNYTEGIAQACEGKMKSIRKKCFI